MKAAQIRGTGLGLPLSQSIAEAMNGRILVTSVTNVPERGTTFTLCVPCAEASVQPNERKVVHVA